MTNTKEDSEDATSASNDLFNKFENLALTEHGQGPSTSRLPLAIATNEFYYRFGLNDIERTAVELQQKEKTHPGSSKRSKRSLALSSATNEFYSKLGLSDIDIKKAAAELQQKTVAEAEKKASRKEKKIRKKKEKADEKASLVLKKTQEKFQKLTFTVKNDRMQTSADPRTSQTGKRPENLAGNANMEENNPLLQRLKQLQTGKISSEQLLKKHPLPPPKKSHLNQADEMQRNREEIQRLNLKIQEKIAHQIKPRLRTIVDRPEQQHTMMNGFHDSARKKTSSESSQSQREQPYPIVPLRRFIQKQTRPVPIAKTKVKTASDEEVEIYRYSKDDLKQLQSSGTLEIVPRLQQYKINASGHSEFDLFLLQLLSIKDEDERQAEILKTAEKRKLINRTGPRDFKFCTVSVNEEDAKADKTQRKTPEKIVSEIDRLKSVAKSDDQLNELIYQYEFSRLFKDAMTDTSVTGQSFPEVMKYLVDTNQAYIIEGEIRVNGKKNQEAYVTQGNGKKDVCVNKLILRQHAFEGDFVRVLVKQQSGNEEGIVPKEEVVDPLSDDDLDATLESDLKENDGDRHYGCVLNILEKRHSRRVIGSLSARASSRKSRNHVSFNVRDSKIPNVQVDRDGIPKNVDLTEKMLMVVQITGWSHDTPKGKVVEIIGVKGELKAENAAILLQNNLNPEPFSQHILDQLPTEPFAIPAKEFDYREDLRKKCIFSIDPETARDLDDALSCEVLPNGNLEIGVHISDVTYFLKENSELDNIVKEKATTIYLVDTVYHMLPVPLCLLCSLLPGADKMAYSVFWKMNAETAEIINTRFARSVVNSCAKLSYDHAQAVLEKENQNWSELQGDFPEIYNGFTISDVADVIVKLQKIAVILRMKRKESGSLKIDQPKIAFKFDKDDQRMEAPVDFFQYCIKDSNRLIEDFMLLANISVAKFIYEKFPEISLLRHHAPPKENALKKLVHTLQKNGIEIDVSSASSLSASMERLIESPNSTAGINAVLNLLVSKTMTRAVYFCSNFADGESAFWHYALSMPIYTHFTSPIRRYADVMVHRVLNAALGYEDPPSRTPDEVQVLANVCNAQKYAAKLAGDDSSNLYFMQFIRSLKTRPMTAGVVGIYDYNLEVVLVETGHLLKVYYKNLQHNDDVIVTPFTDHERPHVIVRWTKLKMSKLVITFGSQLQVEVSVSKDKLTANRIFLPSMSK